MLKIFNFFLIFGSLSAVYGGMFILRCGSISLLFDDKLSTEFRGIRCLEGDLRAKQLILNSAQLVNVKNTTARDDSNDNAAPSADELHVCCCVTTQPLHHEEQLSFVVIPPSSRLWPQAVYGLQLDSSMYVVPQGLCKSLFRSMCG